MFASVHLMLILEEILKLYPYQMEQKLGIKLKHILKLQFNSIKNILSTW